MKKETKIIHSGRNKDVNKGCVNIPIYLSSTILFDNIGEMDNSKYVYGRTGNITNLELQKIICEMEGGYETIVTSCGLSAITTTLTALLKQGDHILVTDGAYSPTKNFCDDILKKFGVEVTYYDPSGDGDIEKLIKKNTKIIFLESPASMTFEIQDIPAIKKVADKYGIILIMDNSWATPLYFDALGKGADISIHAATKYMGGSSDIMLGTITTKNKELYDKIYFTFKNTGARSSPYESYLVARTIKTLSVRLKHHEKSALEIARWLEKRSEVKQVFHPALESHKNHKIWKRDFTGSTGLFSFELNKNFSPKKVDEFVNNLKLFGIGYSWGGFESLIMPFHPPLERALNHKIEGSLIRLHIGLEDIDDLKNDLATSFDNLCKS